MACKTNYDFFFPKIEKGRPRLPMSMLMSISTNQGIVQEYFLCIIKFSSFKTNNISCIALNNSYQRMQSIINPRKKYNPSLNDWFVFLCLFSSSLMFDRQLEAWSSKLKPNFRDFRTKPKKHFNLFLERRVVDSVD